jgi:very-short-patch-repair endonuclease
LSHRSAAALWGMLPAPSTVVHVTVPGRAGRSRRAGLRMHRPRDLRVKDVTQRGGFPVTSMAKTLLDIAATEPDRVVERALDGADTERVLDMVPIDARAPRGCGLPGAGRLRRVLDEHLPGTTISRSTYEEAMLALCRRHGLPRPVMNRYVGVWEADFLWPEHQLVVEVQSTKYHATSQRMARGSVKEGELQAAGYLVLHVVDRHIVHEPRCVAELVAGVLRQRGASLRS